MQRSKKGKAAGAGATSDSHSPIHPSTYVSKNQQPDMITKVWRWGGVPELRNSLLWRVCVRCVNVIII